ncbi:MAG: GNAT family N-acetyltransferase [Caldilineaceae bacterium]
MENGQPCKIIAYDEQYALATVQMWRASMERALGIKDHHTWEEQLNYLKELVQKYSVYLALDEAADQVVGFMVVGGTELDQLYIHVDYQGRGIGTQLLTLAKALSPGKLQLYTFEVNQKAQAFYEKHGFTIIGRGVESESGMADIRYEWVQEF